MGRAGDIGAIDNISGNNSWAGAVTEAGSPNVDGTALFPAFTAAAGLDAGVITPTYFGVSSSSTLTLSNAISGANDMVEVGGGTMDFGGDIANTYTGATRIKSGTLELNKPAGVNAITGTGIFVGDDTNSDTGTLLLNASNQIIDTATIQVGSAGTVNFNNNSEIIGTLVLTTGPNGSSDVTLGTGTLAFTGATPVTLQTYGNNNTTTATISDGTLALDALVGNGAVDTGTAVSARLSSMPPGQTSRTRPAGPI